MDLEPGLKITHAMDDVASSDDFHIVKDKSGPLFVSKETESTFILTIHLKGYKKEHIKIDINEAGTNIEIHEERPVQEKEMLGLIMHKKEVETKGFQKVFRIPNGVVLDRIKAKFDEQESILTIVMPKLVKGVVGAGIEEVKEDRVDIRRSQITQAVAKEVPKNDVSRVKGKRVGEEGTKIEIVANGILEKDMSGSKMQEMKDSKIQSIQDTKKTASKNCEEPKIKEGDRIEIEKVGRMELDTDEIELQKRNEEEFLRLNDQIKKQKTSKAEREMSKAGLEDVCSRPESSVSSKTDQVLGKQFTDEIYKEIDVVELQKQEPIKEDSSNYQHEKGEGSNGIANESQHKEDEKEIKKCESYEMENQIDRGEKSTLEKQPEGLEKSKILCSPFIIAGSALLVSLVILVFHRIRTRKG